MKSPEFEIRMQLLLAKREEHVRKVLHRFECDLEATTERLVYNKTGSVTMEWRENCWQAFSSPDGELSDVRTGDVVAHYRTNWHGGSNSVDLFDCNNLKLYTIYESVYNLVGPNFEACGGGGLLSACGGDIYIRYLIASKTGKTVAYTQYLPIFSSEFNILDSESGGIVARLKKNGDWSAKTLCPAYAKNWLIDFPEVVGVSPGTELGAFLLQDVRWATAAFISIVGLRDESRYVDGSVQYSSCKKHSMVIFIIFMCSVGLIGGVFISLWIKFRLAHHATFYMLKLQDKILPQVAFDPT